MSIYYGDEAIAYLAKKSEQNDIKSSSHWNNYHSDFRFEDYPWHLASEIQEDELCPWTQKYYNFQPPFYRNYLGPFRHRLVIFS